MAAYTSENFRSIGKENIMFRLGVPELLIILIVFPIFGAIVIIPLWQICKRAGFNPALGLLGAVPIAHLCLMFFLAFAEWPAAKGLSESRRQNQ
jgi:hypothetical protein